MSSFKDELDNIVVVVDNQKKAKHVLSICLPGFFINVAAIFLLGFNRVPWIVPLVLGTIAFVLGFMGILFWLSRGQKIVFMHEELNFGAWYSTQQKSNKEQHYPQELIVPYRSIDYIDVREYRFSHLLTGMKEIEVSDDSSSVVSNRGAEGSEIVVHMRDGTIYRQRLGVGLLDAFKREVVKRGIKME